MSPTTKAHQKASNKYMKNHYDRVNLFVPKGQRDVFRAHAESQGESLNAFACRAMREAMEREAVKKVDNSPEE